MLGLLVRYQATTEVTLFCELNFRFVQTFPAVTLLKEMAFMFKGPFTLSDSEDVSVSGHRKE